LNVGSVTTGAAGSSALVTNSGTTSNAIFNFTIPQGATGPPGSASQSVTIHYKNFLRSTGSLDLGFYADSFVVIGWDSNSYELNMRQPTARASVYATILSNNGGSFPSGAYMILTTTNNDYWYQPSTGILEITISSDIDNTHPFYKVRVVCSGAQGNNYIYTVVEKYTLP
jgi:hypothetical protein